MSQIKQLLLLHQQEQKIKFMARCLGMSKNTVKSYLALISKQDKTLDELLRMDDPSLQFIFHGVIQPTRMNVMNTSRKDWSITPPN